MVPFFRSLHIHRIVPFAALFLTTFVFYLLTSAPDLVLVDSSFFALVSAKGGIAHPPGFPLYLLLGKVFAALPFASPARMVTVMSCFFGAAASACIYGIASVTIGIIDKRDEYAAHKIWPAVFAAVAFATSRNLWTWSGVQEVYTLNIFLICASWLAALKAYAIFSRWVDPAQSRSRDVAGYNATIPKPFWCWVIACCVFSCLGLANHHATTLLIFPCLMLILLVASPRLLLNTRLLLIFGVCLAGSLSLYLYLFIASHNDPSINWGGIHNFNLLARHITGGQYHDILKGAGRRGKVIADFWQLLCRGCGIPALIAIIGGLGFGIKYVKGWRNRTLALGVPALLIGLNFLLSTLYVVGPEDRMAYDLPATAAWCVLSGIGVRVISRLLSLMQAKIALAVLIAASITLNVAMNNFYCNLSRETTARTLVKECLDPLPRNAVVITAEWDLYAPYLYLRHVEGYRTDLFVIDVLMMRRFWYMDYLRNHFAELLPTWQPEFGAFAREVSRFDLGKPFDRRNMQALYDRCMLKLVSAGKQRGGAYADWACLHLPQELSWMRRAPARPQGLLLKFSTSPTINVLMPKEAENLKYIRSKLTNAVLRGDRSLQYERHDPYRKVWIYYQNAVESSLLGILQQEGHKRFRKVAADYENWYPDIATAMRAVERNYRRNDPNNLH
ncbi:MAG: DUF2723 domain-containing protein [Chitinivibrionales bacterium]|nr:DUF2723 domain-containing protein [Chitinivibrionales bacterium]